MNTKRFTDYIGVPRSRKVKHVKFIETFDLDELEASINDFADDHPEYKILGIKLIVSQPNYIGVVTYLEDAKGVAYMDYEDDSYED